MGVMEQMAADIAELKAIVVELKSLVRELLDRDNATPTEGALSVAQFAKVIPLSPRTILARIATGEIRSVLCGRKRMIPRDVVDEILGPARRAKETKPAKRSG
jgi:excisionase family DNA binding protein